MVYLAVFVPPAGSKEDAHCEQKDNERKRLFHIHTVVPIEDTLSTKINQAASGDFSSRFITLSNKQSAPPLTNKLSTKNILRAKNSILIYLLTYPEGKPWDHLHTYIRHTKKINIIDTQFDQALQELILADLLHVRKITDDKGILYIELRKVDRDRSVKYLLTSAGDKLARPGFSLLYRGSPFQRVNFNTRIQGLFGAALKTVIEALVRQGRQKKS